MKKSTNTKTLVEVGLNKYGQRLDEFNEFGQSLEAEAWHFDGAIQLSVAPVPAREVALNKFGQRLDEFNEFGQSLEAEAWYFDTAGAVPVKPLPALECLIRPAQEKKSAGRLPAALHRQAA